MGQISLDDARAALTEAQARGVTVRQLEDDTGASRSSLQRFIAGRGLHPTNRGRVLRWAERYLASRAAATSGPRRDSAPGSPSPAALGALWAARSMQEHVLGLIDRVLAGQVDVAIPALLTALSDDERAALAELQVARRRAQELAQAADEDADARRAR